MAESLDAGSGLTQTTFFHFSLCCPLVTTDTQQPLHGDSFQWPLPRAASVQPINCCSMSIRIPASSGEVPALASSRASSGYKPCTKSCRCPAPLRSGPALLSLSLSLRRGAGPGRGRPPWKGLRAARLRPGRDGARSRRHHGGCSARATPRPHVTDRGCFFPELAMTCSRQRDRNPSPLEPASGRVLDMRPGDGGLGMWGAMSFMGKQQSPNRRAPSDQPWL